MAVTLLFTLTIRAKDLPPPDPVSPTQYLEDRKAQIYENLRDLQFEYRVGKLSDEDYQQTKLGLQKELAGVLGEIEKFGTGPSARRRRSAARESCRERLSALRREIPEADEILRRMRKGDVGMKTSHSGY